VLTNVVLQTSYTEIANDKPKFESAEAAAQWNAPMLKSLNIPKNEKSVRE
jgi:hypothetical protein